MGLMVKGTRILVVDPPKSWLRVPQKVMPRNPDKLAYANTPYPPAIASFKSGDHQRGSSRFTEEFSNKLSLKHPNPQFQFSLPASKITKDSLRGHRRSGAVPFPN